MLARAALLGTLLFGYSLVLAADDEIPEPDLIEYLGMWEGSDEEWLIFEEPVAADNDERNDPAPQGEASTEKDDES